MSLPWLSMPCFLHYSDVIMDAIASQITSLTIVYSSVYSGANQRKHQSSASLAFVRGIHRWTMNSPHKWPVTRKIITMTSLWARWRLKSPGHVCLLNRLFRRRSKKTSKLRVTGLCAGNSPVTGEFPAQMTRNPENVSIWWRHALIAESSATTILTL